MFVDWLLHTYSEGRKLGVGLYVSYGSSSHHIHVSDAA